MMHKKIALLPATDQTNFQQALTIAEDLYPMPDIPAPIIEPWADAVRPRSPSLPSPAPVSRFAKMARLRRASSRLLAASRSQIIGKFESLALLPNHRLSVNSRPCSSPYRISPKPRTYPFNSEPIAIIGIGCRLPGEVDSPGRLWSLLRDGRQALGPLPPDRESLWPVPCRRPRSHWAAFCRGWTALTPPSFASPREAQSLDPQQRILLEVSWQTLEHAGIDPDPACRERDGGVYRHLLARPRAAGSQAESGAGPYFLTGCSAATAAGRLSFFYDLRGPAVAVDTASSASLVAVHLACAACKRATARWLLVGGVNLILGPETYDCYRQAGMLSPDGRCTAFDAQANGYVRGEGCGLVLLQPLQAAQAAGRRVLAVLRGSAINQDGAAAALTLPSQAAQEALIAKALTSAALNAKDISYVEAHGSGTPVGDPIEGGLCSGPTASSESSRCGWVHKEQPGTP